MTGGRPYRPVFVSIVTGGGGGPVVRPTPALAPGQDVVIDLHPELRTRTGTSAAKLHALAIAHTQLAGTVHVRGCNRPVRHGVAMVLATALNVPVTTHLGTTGNGEPSGQIEVAAVRVRAVLVPEEDRAEKPKSTGLPLVDLSGSPRVLRPDPPAR